MFCSESITPVVEGSSLTPHPSGSGWNGSLGIPAGTMAAEGKWWHDEMDGSSSPSQEDLVDVKEEVRLLKIQAWLSRFFHFEKLQALSLSLFFWGGVFCFCRCFSQCGSSVVAGHKKPAENFCQKLLSQQPFFLEKVSSSLVQPCRFSGGYH